MGRFYLDFVRSKVSFNENQLKEDFERYVELVGDKVWATTAEDSILFGKYLTDQGIKYEFGIAEVTEHPRDNSKLLISIFIEGSDEDVSLYSLQK